MAQLTSKFDNFESQVTHKISQIEHGYAKLESRV